MAWFHSFALIFGAFVFSIGRSLRS